MAAQNLVCARAAPFHDDAWVLGLRLLSGHPARAQQSTAHFHFVLDNSASMGSDSRTAKNCFASLVDLATGPCSLVAFNETATLVGDAFHNSQSMKAAELPRQGGTNITAGIEKGLEVIAKQERSDPGAIHHVLVLLSDGAHNRGPKPQDALPTVGADLRAGCPRLRLSVVVVGVTRSSDTSMGMLVKHCLETLPLELQPIYFAQSAAAMQTVLEEMSAGLANLAGAPINVALCGEQRFVRELGAPPVSTLDVFAGADELQLVLCGECPAEVVVDGVTYKVTCIEFDMDLTVSALQVLMGQLRVQRVALGSSHTQPAVQQLSVWIDELETRCNKQAECSELSLSKATPAMRLAQYKAMKRVTTDAKELRNALEGIQAMSSNDSSSQAAFLTGADSKFAAKALRRAANHSGVAIDPQQKRAEIVEELKVLAPKVQLALRLDFKSAIMRLEAQQRSKLEASLRLELPALCDESGHSFWESEALNAAIDSGRAFTALSDLTGAARQSFLSLQSTAEHLKDWVEAATLTDGCQNEYELLMCAGCLGYPIEVKRCAATQMDPYNMSVGQVKASLADTASLLTALQSDHPVVGPEGGEAIQDLLVLVDPEAPRASRLVANSALMREAYTSVVLCRDLHMFTGNKMREALHAHALLAALQPPSSQGNNEAFLRRQYLGRAFQCASCGFGPIDHYGCGDLLSHHMERDGAGGVAKNSCPRCDWFSEDLSDWPAWDGKVPKEAGAESSSDGRLTASAAEIALRICYSARALFSIKKEDDLSQLCEKLAAWHTMTTADGVDHPVQVLLALAVVDELPDAALDEVSLHLLLNEVCARKARQQLRSSAGCDESKTAEAARKLVCGFLGVERTSAPQAAALGVAEPQRDAVAETCSVDFALMADKFDYSKWIKETLTPWEHALRGVQRLRKVVKSRPGGWQQLAKDMEMGHGAFDDVVEALSKPSRKEESLRSLLRVQSAETAPRVLATMAAQAFLHHSSQKRRTFADGGALHEPLGDVRDVSTLQGLCRDLRMAFYDDSVTEKMRQWGQVGASMTYQRAMAADLDQFAHLCSGHAHGLDGPTFWGLWHAAKAGGHDKARVFLSGCNREFVNKYG